MTLTTLLAPERVLPRLRVRDRETALRALAALIARDTNVPLQAILKEAMLAADFPPFMPRGGVSLMHTLVSGMENPMAAFARLEPSLDCGAPDGCPTDLLILLVSPTGRPQDHLRALACIARRLRRQDVRRLVRGTSSRDAMFVALTSDEWAATGTYALGLARTST